MIDFLILAEAWDIVRVNLGAGLAMVGAFFSMTGSIGVIRFPDFYTRMHAASVTDTLGASLVLLGLMLLGGWSLVTFKLLAIWIFLLFTSPTASNAAANGALKDGVLPLLGRWTGQKQDADDLKEKGEA